MTAGHGPKALAAVALLAALGAASCGQSTSPGSSDTVTLTVLGAASLTKALPEVGRLYTAAHHEVRFGFTFGGSDALAVDIEQGAPADLFAGASTKYAIQLAGEGLVETPTPFATNALVVIVPRSDPGGISTLHDLTRPGIKLVIGAEAVPVGSYTRAVLANLSRDPSYGAGFAGKVLMNVVSNEDSVTGVLTKVELGEADAGFVYVTDAEGAGSSVRAVTLPQSAQAVAVYPVTPVKASRHLAQAEAFARFLLGTQAQAVLQRAGFGPPPAA